MKVLNHRRGTVIYYLHFRNDTVGRMNDSLKSKGLDTNYSLESGAQAKEMAGEIEGGGRARVSEVPQTGFRLVCGRCTGTRKVWRKNVFSLEH